MKKNIILVLVCAFAAAAASYATVRCTPAASGDNLTQAGESFHRTVNLDLDDYPDFTYAAESAVDAVVYVKVTVTDKVSQPSSIFDFFFGYEGTPQQRERVGSGSGVIIREDGYIVTNNHVIDNASKIEVTLNNNETYEAKLVGTDPATDVALIKIEANNLPIVPMGDSDQLRLGEWVIAIGSPYDLRSTITAGIVSAKGRSMPNYSGEFKIESFIQTDAAVNPGNSGGALVNKAGQLVGINTAIISQTGSYTGYSFAVPVNIVKRIIADLMDFGSVKRAMLGITMQNIDKKLAEELKLSSLNGVYVVEVASGSAAEAAGIKKGDVLVKIGGVNLKDGASVQEKVNSYRPGENAEITLIRDGKELVLNVEFKASASETGSVDETGAVAFYGSRIQAASKDVLKALGAKKGVEVVSVGPGKLADAGVSEGFVILYVNNVAVGTPQDILNIIKKSERAVYVEGVDKSGRANYFGFAK
ncbi:MAG: Do family serine endopeptidase [Bacteroidales bacterium]|nr:Do family serine endopeptidase [Bacteroidales bacterium]